MKSSPWAAALRAAAKVEVTKLDPKWLPLLPMSSLSITEASPTLRLEAEEKAQGSRSRGVNIRSHPPSDSTGRGRVRPRCAPQIPSSPQPTGAILEAMGLAEPAIPNPNPNSAVVLCARHNFPGTPLSRLSRSSEFGLFSARRPSWGLPGYSWGHFGGVPGGSGGAEPPQPTVAGGGPREAGQCRYRPGFRASRCSRA
mgnify:CR=1 FL=1